MADNKDKKVLNVPALRFPEFNGEWITRPIKDIADFIGGGTPSSANEAYWQGTIPWVSSSDIVEDNINDITISRYITEEAISNSATKLCSAPVILIVSRVGVGKVALSSKAICTSQDFCNLINIKVHPTFLAYSLSQIMKRKSIEVQGTSIKGITSLEIQKIILHIPSLQEQHKISDLFQLIDKRIAVQSKIIEKYESLIQAISQKVLRPSEYWNEYRLCELADIRSGYSGNQVSHKTAYAVSRIETISKHRIDMLRVGYVQDIPSEYKLNVGDILFSNINSIQYIGNTAFVDKEYNLYHGMNLLRIIPKPSLVIPRFLHLILCTSMAIKHFQSICNKAVSQASINQTSLGKIMLHIPPLTCQEQICNVFESVEQRLNLEVYYLKRIQLQKNYLLRQMFI